MSDVAADPYTVWTNPAVVSQPESQVALGLKVPLETTIRKLPLNVPVTPSPITPPSLVPDSQAPGLDPLMVTNRPAMKLSVTAYVPPVGVVAASKTRTYVSVTTTERQVP